MISQSPFHPVAQDFMLQDYKNIPHKLKEAGFTGSYF